MKQVAVVLVLALVAQRTLAADPTRSIAVYGTPGSMTPGARRLHIAHEAARWAREGALYRTNLQAARQQTTNRNWIGRHPMLFGALVGFGVGCVLGASQVGGSQDDFFNALDEFACPVVGGMGAGGGALVGWALTRTR